MHRLSFQSDIGRISYLYREGRYPVIMLHGLGGTGNSFLKMALKLPNNLALIMPDLLGHGRTKAEVDAFTISNQSLVVRRITEQLGISRFALYGHSYGGWISLNFSINYGGPDFLLLEDSAGMNPAVGEGGEHTTDQFLERIMSMSPGNNIESIRSILTNNATREKKITVEQLRNIKQRTLIMWGQNDNIIPIDFGRLMHENIKRSDFVIFPNSAHSPHLTCPERVANVVSSFLEAVN